MLLSIFAGFVIASAAFGQRETPIQPASEPSQYGRNFFVQLRAVFGRFRDADLELAFERAHPIDCAELVNENGDWRTVAFFNEKRELGDWYRGSLEEVKSDLSAFIFKGVCRGAHGPVQLVTKFPVSESLDAYNQRRIGLDEIEVNVNAPVRASFDTQTQAYTFDLPYMFLVGEKDGESVYSLAPPRLADREQYARDVTNHWECKSVAAENVTYRFLICRTGTQPRTPAMRNQRLSRVFGSSAYFILSDGREASSNVTLSFGDGDSAKQSIEDLSVPANAAPESVRWTVPDPDERLVSVFRDEFRIQFNPQSWAGRTGTAQGLAAQRLSDLSSFDPPPTADSCVWLPGATHGSGEVARYAVTLRDRDARSSTTVEVRMSTAAGAHVGTLQCFFPRSADVDSIAFSRWMSIVGANLKLEVR